MPVNFDIPVVRVAVWQRAQPTLLNRLAPFVADADIGRRRGRRGETHEGGEVHQVR